jgi:GTP cyclohydrolase IA
MAFDSEVEERITKMHKEFSRNLELKPINNSNKYTQLIIQKDIPFMALCEHHHVSFSGEISIGYVPKDGLLGLSKLGRIIEKFFNPTVYTLQERGTQKIIDYLSENFELEGAIIIIKAIHGCVAYRGVKKISPTITTAFNGVFTKPEARMEFLRLLDC